MPKDSFWFRHDANARNDPKMSQLLMIGGQGAKGSFWDLVEILRESEGYKIPLDKLPAIAFACRFPDNAIDQMVKCGLLKRDKKNIWSESLNRRMEHLDAIREKRVEAGRIGGKVKPSVKQTEANAKQVLNRCQPNEKQTPSKSKRSDLKGSDLSRSKKKEGKGDLPGVLVWETYQKAFFSEYGCEPIRNAKVNTACKAIVQAVGIKEATHLVNYYLNSKNDYYMRQKHPIEMLLKDIQKLRTEWKTGREPAQTNLSGLGSERLTPGEAKQKRQAATIAATAEKLRREGL